MQSPPRPEPYNSTFVRILEGVIFALGRFFSFRKRAMKILVRETPLLPSVSREAGQFPDTCPFLIGFLKEGAGEVF